MKRVILFLFIVSLLGGCENVRQSVGVTAKPLSEKWESFGWDTVELDGHDIDQLHSFFQSNNTSDKPKAIVAKTVKGKGFSFSENNNDWHHSVLTKSLYETALKELKLIK